MSKENSSNNELRLVETEDIVFCPKCSRKNQKEAERCVECNFPLNNTVLTKIIPIEFSERR